MNRMMLLVLKLTAFLFAQRSWQTLSLERKGHHPDQGEDNPNCKGVIGNGGV